MNTGGIGGWQEKANLEVVRETCRCLDNLAPMTTGHDLRYVIDQVTARADSAAPEHKLLKGQQP